jgi:hypothetical protein
VITGGFRVWHWDNRDLQLHALGETFMWGVIAGGVITILVAIVFEYLRTPKLALSIESPPLSVLAMGSFPARTHLRIVVSNRALPFIAMRSSALRCRGTIAFRHLDDGQEMFGSRMEGRWAGSPEPVPIQIVSADGHQMSILDTQRLTVESRIDISPGESEFLDVAVRIEEEDICYGWNNESYFYNWRHPRWQLPKGRYLVQVTVICSGYRTTGLYRLMNTATRRDFRLEPATSDDWQRIERTTP